MVRSRAFTASPRGHALLDGLTECRYEEVRCTYSDQKADRGPMRRYRVAAIPGDGIGSGVIAAGLEGREARAARDGGR